MHSDNSFCFAVYNSHIFALRCTVNKLNSDCWGWYTVFEKIVTTWTWSRNSLFCGCQSVEIFTETDVSAYVAMISATQTGEAYALFISTSQKI